MKEGYEPVPGHEGCYGRDLVLEGGGAGMECSLVRIEPGGGGPLEPHTHGHDHLVIVLRGSLTIKQGNTEASTQAPAAVRVEGSVPHSFRNAGVDDVELAMIGLPREAAAGALEPDRLEEIRRLALSFCAGYLDEEYSMLCNKAVDGLAEYPQSVFASGRASIWAGGVVHALATNNNLFSKRSRPHIERAELASFFGASGPAIANRGRQIREMLDMDYRDQEYASAVNVLARKMLASMLEPKGLDDEADAEKLLTRIRLSRGHGLVAARSARNRKRRFDRVYRFKVTLLETEPPIWRRILVPGDYSFWDLHVAIQDAMGWLGYHLHRFEMEKPDGTGLVEIGMPDEEDVYLGPEGVSRIALPGWEEKIRNWFTEDNRRALYEYDFGDGWEHEVLLEEVLPRELRMEYPACTGGALSCPPEDCGGVYGYYELLDILSDPSHSQHEYMKEWAGPYFQPDDFSPDETHFTDPNERFIQAFEF